MLNSKGNFYICKSTVPNINIVLVNKNSASKHKIKLNNNNKARIITASIKYTRYTW